MRLVDKVRTENYNLGVFHFVSFEYDKTAIKYS